MYGIKNFTAIINPPQIAILAVGAGQKIPIVNDDKIVIMRSWCVDKDDNHGGGAIAIPRGWVTKIEYLEVSYAKQNYH